MLDLVERNQALSEIGPTTRDSIFQPNLGLTSVMFMAFEAQDNAADAVRDSALDLGVRAERPVLLLDLAIPGNRHYRSFHQDGLVLPRRAAKASIPADFAVLHFEKLHDSQLYVSRVTPDPSAFSDSTWRIAGREGLRRLHVLFATIVIAAPELAVSEAGLTLAPEVDGVVLVLRSGMTRVAEARAMRDRVLRAGGQILGTVLTHSARRTARRRARHPAP